MRRMLGGLPVLLNVDYLEHKSDFHATEKVIFTGPIDEFYGFKHGKLAYRGQIRDHEYRPGVDSVYPKGQINTPSRELGDHVRVLEWKHMMEEPFGSSISGTVLTTETPFSPEDPSDYEYPFPDQSNQDLYAEYRALAEDDADNVLICGRLGEYRYYDMDQAIGRAMKLTSELDGWQSTRLGYTSD
ncbi:MAG: hypothetical protein GEU79_07420 [Acidimicrobiia bacterium]|nr:hypothetical protein [Acidimicrobiia bacterium]